MMKTIYHSKLLVAGMILISLALVLSAWIESNLTYKLVHLCLASAFLFFSIYSLRFPAVKIEGNAIHVRQFFCVGFKTVNRSNFFFMRKNWEIEAFYLWS